MNKIKLIIFTLLFAGNLFAESNLDQWKDSNKTYKDLINEGFDIKSYDTMSLKIEGDLTILFFITVLQKKKEVFECQEYQTLDNNLLTLDISIMCRELTQPYRKGLGT